MLSRVRSKISHSFPMYSTVVRETPSKSHYHQPISDDHFPKLFRLGGIHCGIKKSQSQSDLALIVSDAPKERTAAAACFTRNAVRAAPVLVCEEVLAKDNRVRSLVVNSGCANAVTGAQGLSDARAMSAAAASALLSSDSQDTNGGLVMSTGVIGQMLPINKILSGIQNLNPTLTAGFSAWEKVAKAVMTTDTFPKLRARTFDLEGIPVRLAGIDKGAGMIHPRMGAPQGVPHATLLGFVASDAYLEPDVLQDALTHAVQRSFNSISVDGDMSTNDTVIAIANGASGMKNPIQRGSAAFDKFQSELTEFCADLAQLVVRDGEGARKFVAISVQGGKNFDDAHKVASAVSTSLLVKTALYGEDANWGRVLAAMGGISDSLSCPLELARISVWLQPGSSADDSTPLNLLKDGEPCFLDENRAKNILSQEDINIIIELGVGHEQATYWTCDLSHEYVTINGDYRS